MTEPNHIRAYTYAHYMWPHWKAAATDCPLPLRSGYSLCIWLSCQSVCLSFFLFVLLLKMILSKHAVIELITRQNNFAVVTATTTTYGSSMCDVLCRYELNNGDREHMKAASAINKIMATTKTTIETSTATKYKNKHINKHLSFWRRLTLWTIVIICGSIIIFNILASLRPHSSFYSLSLTVS